MFLYLVYPDVTAFDKREVAKRLQDIAEVLREVNIFIGLLPPGEALSPQNFDILQQTVARLYPATTEASPAATERPSLHPLETLFLLDHTILARYADRLQDKACELVHPLTMEAVLASGQLLPPVVGPLSQDYQRLLGWYESFPVSVPPQRYAHLAECEHSHNSLAVFLSVTLIKVPRRIIKCTVCETVSQAAVLVPNQQLSAQEKRKIFQSVLCRWCYDEAIRGFDGFHYRSNLEEEDGPPGEEEVGHQEQTMMVQQPPPDVGRLDDNCGICQEPLGTHGRIAILSSCGHVFGESCLRRSLATITISFGMCPTCRKHWSKAIILAGTDAPEAKLAITSEDYRYYLASRVLCFGHGGSTILHI